VMKQVHAMTIQRAMVQIHQALIHQAVQTTIQVDTATVHKYHV